MAALVLRLDDEETESVIIAPRFPADTTQPIGRRSDAYHLVTAVERSRGSRSTRSTDTPTFVQHGTEPNARLARDVVAGPHVGLQARSRSAAAGQGVAPGADAPGTGELRLLELAAADLGAPTLALAEAVGLDVLGRFAITRHGNSLTSAIREV